MKIIVAHPAQQHSYKLAIALQRRDMLFRYVTTVYYKKGSLTTLVAKVLKGNFKKKAQNRHMDEVPSDKVIQFCEGEGLFKLLALNKPAFGKYYNTIKYHVADRFAKRVAKYAIKNQVDAVITYDDSSPLLFEILKKEAPDIVRILDVSAANLQYMRQIYEKDAELQPTFSDRLHRERAIIWDEEIMGRALREIQSADYFLTPSEFVKKSLKYSGVCNEKMILCPYGVDVGQFECKTFEPIKNNRPLRFIYVGGVKELKGISYLLDAFMGIPKEQATLTVVGAFDAQDKDIQPYIGRVEFSGSVLHTQIPELLKSADVYVFASLGEGLSLSTLEAAACGLPLIVTENSGVNDEIENGREGFVIPIQSTQAIREKVEWFIKNPDRIEPMGRAARELALEYTWERYCRTVADLVENVVNTDS